MTIHPYYFSTQKRLFDIVVSLLLLVGLLPLFLGILCSSLLTIGWPPFYVQQRAGKNMLLFRMYKFRTMYRDAHQDQHKYAPKNQAPQPMFKLFEDPRFVGIGRWLSKTGFDELPQLFNVLAGSMSLVGPRPLPFEEAKQLLISKKHDWQFRHRVKPGIFSEWTISKKRHSNLENWRKLDRKTLSNGSWWYDFSVIIRTFQTHFL